MRPIITSFVWLVLAYLSFIFIPNLILGLYTWCTCMAFYLISLARSTNGKYRKTPPYPYHPDSGKGTSTRTFTRAFTRAFTAITGGTASSSVVYDDFPILAVKRGNITIGRNNRAIILSIGYDKPHEFDYFDCDAECTAISYDSSSRRHKAPQWGCTCGFYAVPPDILGSFKSMGNYIFEVELSGVVIETERGYRAQHQKIIGIYSDTHTCSHYFTEEIIRRQTGIEVKPWPQYKS